MTVKTLTDAELVEAVASRTRSLHRKYLIILSAD